MKNEAKNCNFKCQSYTFNVSETLIWDQIIIGVSEGFLKECIKKEWTLQQLEDHRRRTEAAALGAAALTDNSYVKISKIAGKYSPKYRNRKFLCIKEGQPVWVPHKGLLHVFSLWPSLLQPRLLPSNLPPMKGQWTLGWINNVSRNREVRLEV